MSASLPHGELQLKLLASPPRAGAKLQQGAPEKKAQPNTCVFSLSSAQPGPSLFPSCAEPCSCQSDDFNPVCDTSAYVEYTTPCHAGCTGRVVQEARGKSQVRPTSYTSSASRPLPCLAYAACHHSSFLPLPSSLSPCLPLPSVIALFLCFDGFRASFFQ